MRKKNILFAIVVMCMTLDLNAQKLPYKDPKLPIPTRVDDLLSRMTVEEKVGQLSKMLGWDMYIKSNGKVSLSSKYKEAVRNQHIGLLWATFRADPWTQKTLETGLSPREAAQASNAIQQFAVDSTRLGIPLLLSEEAPHGHMAIGATVFPTAIGQASTWNPLLIEKMGGVIAQETAAVGGRNGYGPVLDLARDPRWSRTEETYGEDPYLVGRMGKAMVDGFQNNTMGNARIIATLKHFVAYGVPEGGHNGGGISIGERALRHHYLPPFETAVKAGAGSVMTAYNSIDGIPCSSNKWLLQDVLRQEWGFKGFVVSDLLSISGLNGGHATAHDGVEAAKQSIEAGLDVDLSARGYDINLLKAVETGEVSMAVLDQAVARVLRQKFELGLFENPYVDVNQVDAIVGIPQHKELAKQVAQESITLLRNEKALLPLSKNLKRILVVGPNADNMYNQLGDYTAPQESSKIKTLLKGIQETVSKETVVDYVKGSAIRDSKHSDIAAAVEQALKSDVIVVALGGSSARDFKTSYQATGAANIDASSVSDMESGEGFDRASLDMMGDQMELLQALHKTGKPIVLVMIQGRPLNLNWASENIPAIVNAWYPGEQGGNAIASVLFGDYNPAGRLPISIPRSVGQLPVYYNHDKPKKHDYVEMEAGPLYNFGYGLSYSVFRYDNLRLDLKENGDDFTIDVNFDVWNSSPIDGEEVVQLYVVDEVSSVVTPIKQLKRFERRKIASGQSESFYFTLNKEDLKLWNVNREWVTEKGKYTFLIGKSSSEILLQATLELSKDYTF